MTRLTLGTRGFDDATIERDVFDTNVTITTTDTTNPDEFVEAARGTDALLNPPYPTPARVFDELDGLQAVGVYGIGVDHVDLAAATAHGVQVVNVPDYCIEEVSTHALALLLAVSREVVTYDEHVRSGGWDYTHPGTLSRLSGRTLGLVGFGDIARRLAEKVAGFDLTLVAFDPYVDPAVAEEYGVELVPFETLLERATLVSIHTPLTDDTRGLFDRAAFETLDPATVIVNTARAPILNRAALEAAIRNEDIAGVGLDVWWNEPPEETALAEHDSVVVTPHAAFFSAEAQREVRRRAAVNVEHVLEGKPPTNPVNNPG